MLANDIHIRTCANWYYGFVGMVNLSCGLFSIASYECNVLIDSSALDLSTPELLGGS